MNGIIIHIPQEALVQMGNDIKCICSVTKMDLGQNYSPPPSSLSGCALSNSCSLCHPSSQILCPQINFTVATINVKGLKVLVNQYRHA